MANVGVLASLASPEDVILSDALNHASIIDGARLSRAEVVIYTHLDMDVVRRTLARVTGRASRGARRVWVVTESYFSMDADSPDLGALRRACDEAGAGLIVDEAHALGVLGPEGRGVCAERGVTPDVLVGTFGKAFGAGGAFAAGCADLIAWLWNRARSFVFSTGLSPIVAEGARRHVELCRRDPSLRGRALACADELRKGMWALGLEPQGYGVIVPWIIGDAPRALRVAEDLRGPRRLRASHSAAHGSRRVRHAAAAHDDRAPLHAGRHRTRARRHLRHMGT